MAAARGGQTTRRASQNRLQLIHRRVAVFPQHFKKTNKKNTLTDAVDVDVNLPLTNSSFAVRVLDARGAFLTSIGRR